MMRPIITIHSAVQSDHRFRSFAQAAIAPTLADVMPSTPAILGAQHLPAQGGYLILPSELDLPILLRIEAQLAGRKFAYVMDEGAGIDPAVLKHIDKPATNVLVLVPDRTDRGAYRVAMKEAAATQVIIHIPARAATQAGVLTQVPGERLEFLVQAGMPVVPCFVQRMNHVWTPILGSSSSKITVAFGAPLNGDELTVGDYQERMFGLSELCFRTHPVLNFSLGYGALLGLKRYATRNQIVDGKDDKPMGFDKVLAAALALSRFVRKQTQKQRVGIVLPPTPIGLIANLAVLFAGKVPVNLNFTAGRAATQSAIKQADLDCFLTADTFVRKMQAFPWPPTKQLVMLERLMPSLKVGLMLWFVLSKVLPASLLRIVAGVPRSGGDREGLLLFTSGSSGDPKGVALTHRNLMGNVAQFGSRLNMGPKDSVLGCLPLFHSFGCTVTLLYPVMFGLDVVFYPSPLEIKRLAELIQTHRITLMISTPTFLRGYLRGVNREQLASIKLCVTGAEKLPKAVAESFETRFGKRVFEGYGLTETSPVSNLNLEDPTPIGDESAHPVAPSYRFGSTGQLMPGLAIRMTHPETNESQSISQPGIIWFKGVNVFNGYLNDPKRSAEVIDEDGWFRTGDVGRVDADGFLYIEGRLSRFSKIAGEMVPHETVEEALVRALGLEGESSRRVAVVGVPDIERGEALVLLTSMGGGPEAQEIVALRHRLLDRGVPPLWIPKRMIRVTEIPVLASGKLDVKGCEKIARAGSSP
jgi:acyl-[acyl-carrier-protein]-phospholipid O-acyltransferase / long-chain-fatty-acid--[acyl-carrier-protein] ligase